MFRPLEKLLAEVDEEPCTVISSATDYPEGWFIEPHSHAKHQLIYAIEGKSVV